MQSNAGAEPIGAKRSRQVSEAETQIQEAAAEAEDSFQQGGEAGEEQDGEQGTKKAHVETSCIRGTAMPHRPRIGPQYQALVPTWTGPPAAARTERSAAVEASTRRPAEEDQQ
eukprot:jgi/Tetstr1/438185/TSEL_026785.t1